mmetsp:Transcript_6152/g.12510  ORF Transcript_6152/g.12510 Transcript_6152/m.12510 type:complete len:143 (+) Transcript_6152:1111-1539(+)
MNPWLRQPGFDEPWFPWIDSQEANCAIHCAIHCTIRCAIRCAIYGTHRPPAPRWPFLTGDHWRWWTWPTSTTKVATAAAAEEVVGIVLRRRSSMLFDGIAPLERTSVGKTNRSALSSMYMDRRGDLRLGQKKSDRQKPREKD